MLVSQRPFVYIDSSQQQQNSHPELCYYLRPSISPNNKNQENKKIISQKLIKSLSKKQIQKSSPYHQKSLSQFNKQINPFCQITLAQQKILNHEFQNNIQSILNHKLQKEFVNILLLQANEKQIEDNLKKRNEKYNQFIRDMKVDKKYQEILQEKIFKKHIQNQRKKEILKRHIQIQKMKTQQRLLSKYAIEKDQYQTKIVQKLKKKVRKMGVERVNSAHQNVKKELLEKRSDNRNKLDSKANKQYNQILQLKQKLQSIKKQKHINKIEQQKVLKDFQKQIKSKKKQLDDKLKKRKEFII